MQRVLRAGTALSLLLLVACSAPLTTVTSLLPPEQTVTLPVFREPLPVTNTENVLPIILPPAETGTATVPVIVAHEAVIATTPSESAEVTTAPPEYVQSVATYYAKRFKGRRTASGERYDPERMTAATRDFPLQTWLKVINPANGREVVVRVNDRTGKRKTPLIDLSRAAAKELDFLGKGKIRVHVIPLPPGL